VFGLPLDRREDDPAASRVVHFRGSAAPLINRMEDVVGEWSNAKLCDAINLMLGAALFSSSWFFGSGPASQNAFVCGIIIVVISLAALAKRGGEYAGPVLFSYEIFVI